MIQMDDETRGILKTRLTSIGLRDLMPQVEMVILGKAAPIDVVRLLNTAYQTGWYDSEWGSANRIRNLLSNMLGEGFINGNQSIDGNPRKPE